MGACMFLLVEKDAVLHFVSHWYVGVLIAVCSWCAVQRNESEMTYVIDAISSVAVLTVIFANEALKKILSIRAISVLGGYSMEMFLIHPLIYSLIGRRFYNGITANGMKIEIAWFLTWLLCLALIIVLALPLKKLIGYIMDTFMKVAGFGYKMIRKFGSTNI